MCCNATAVRTWLLRLPKPLRFGDQIIACRDLPSTLNHFRVTSFRLRPARRKYGRVIRGRDGANGFLNLIDRLGQSPPRGEMTEASEALPQLEFAAAWIVQSNYPSQLHRVSALHEPT